VPAVGAPAAEPQATATSPSCAVESQRILELDDGTQLQIWDVKASGLERLTIRLLVATDGKVETAKEVEYKWRKWETAAPAATGQLVLLIQDGKAFGAKGKRLPLLAVDLQGSPPHVRIETKKGLVLEGVYWRESHSWFSSAGLPMRSVIGGQLFQPKDVYGSTTWSDNPELWVESSKEGKTAVAVELEWSPQSL
jgi:hypothetical protein